MRRRPTVISFVWILGVAGVANPVLAKPVEIKKPAADVVLAPDARGEFQLSVAPDERLILEAPSIDVRAEFTETKSPVLVFKASGAEVIKSGNHYRVKWPQAKYPETLKDAEFIAPIRVELRGRSMGLDVRSRQILANIKGSKNILVLNGLRVKGDISGGTGDLLGHALEGTITVVNREGRLKWDQQSGALQIKDFKGDIGISNQAGATTVTGGQGALRWVSLKGGLSVQGYDGQIDAQSESSLVRIVDLTGSLTGKSDMGDWSIGLNPKAIARVETAGGNVRAKVPKGSGAKVDLSSEEGRLFAPAPLKAVSEAGFRRILGRLGGSQPGLVQVRTKNGDASVAE